MSQVALGRAAAVEEVASVIVFLASPRASFVTRHHGGGGRRRDQVPVRRVGEGVTAGLVVAIHVLQIYGMAKSRKKPKGKKAGRAAGEEPLHPLYGFQKGLLRVVPGTDLTQPADPELANYLDEKYGKEKPRD